MIELSRDERRLIIFLCCFLLTGALLNVVSVVFPDVAERLGLSTKKEMIDFGDLTPADSARLADLIEQSKVGIKREPVEFPLDINSADVEDLELLPGIGPAKAAAIVALREELGRFGRVEDLVGVRGIGPRTLEKLKPYVKVE
jgi:competence ComEA-like helix-hairpin-helix protein